jgi:hypothetical protein
MFRAVVAVLTRARRRSTPEYPESPSLHRAVRPGGSADSLARAVASGMSIASSSGDRGEQARRRRGDRHRVRRSPPPDGYTILFGSNTGMSGRAVAAQECRTTR